MCIKAFRLILYELVLKFYFQANYQLLFETILILLFMELVSMLIFLVAIPIVSAPSMFTINQAALEMLTPLLADNPYEILFTTLWDVDTSTKTSA